MNPESKQLTRPVGGCYRLIADEEVEVFGSALSRQVSAWASTAGQE
jgi:hypothetical protein